MRKTVQIILLAALGFGLCGPIQAESSPLTPIKAALQANHPQEAYRLAQDLDKTYAGEPQFDYWFGRAALASGHFPEATFAFERILIGEPGHQPARIFLAQAYEKMGKPEVAKIILGK